MLKTMALTATCKNGKVTVNGAEVPGAVILPAGKAKSNGMAILSGEKVFYIAVPVDTLADLIDLVGTLADTVASGVLPSNGGGAITSGTFAADLAQIKTQLTQLKGAMQ